MGKRTSASALAALEVPGPFRTEALQSDEKISIYERYQDRQTSAEITGDTVFGHPWNLSRPERLAAQRPPDHTVRSASDFTIDRIVMIFQPACLHFALRATSALLSNGRSL
ncbi:uncharacterized protein L969DRAFT_92893 [Mixia osmundae IAM 14324]|uniref:Uncharacterized protein n=1 Tax=Mixia osmundae (strain CBS 9802 / IAM 14324 / JCM 22182 / KY 12970) TaxID=764103 RepID=G7DYV9_MIXOS|nr:uncharacterized protein L969DRAFT_92893 [Mixia osmundae IAM 14324]KEI41665.1 hypothetical protein L969DRAFT_92893 [Mixia osmundae IAM 14324]GAA95769.1 hypothetical protein E5Q_02426 [Mixia osmundae IAM 14324]